MGLLFVGSLVSGMLPAYQGQSSPQGATEPSAAAALQVHALQEQARKYEQILAQEPNNLAALEGLVQTRLSLRDPQGAIAPLETLVKLYPDRTDYQSQLESAQQQIGNSSALRP